MDPRLTPETPVAEQGPVRIYQLTDKPRLEVPPLLNGCQITLRHQIALPDVDRDVVASSATERLVPILHGMDGFVLYCGILSEGGWVAIDIWETASQMQAGNEAVAVWEAENSLASAGGESVTHHGVISYSDILGRD